MALPGGASYPGPPDSSGPTSMTSHHSRPTSKLTSRLISAHLTSPYLT